MEARSVYQRAQDQDLVRPGRRGTAIRSKGNLDRVVDRPARQKANARRRALHLAEARRAGMAAKAVAR